MSFQKQKMTRFGVTADYHTIIDVRMNFRVLPQPIIENGSPVGLKPGSVSSIVIGSFKGYSEYMSGAVPLETKDYEVDFMTAISVARSTEKTCEKAAYDLIKQMDTFYSDAIEVQ